MEIFMKIYKRLLTLLIVFSLFLTMLFVISTSAAEEDGNLSTEEIEAHMDAQVNALDAYQKLFDTFDKQDDGSFLYPKDYAGAYIEGDKLIIMLTSVNEQSIANYNAIFS